eukprot:m.205084 g.205084  ORF g.205084 m.205084 type:complete len:1184 (+) comp17092_c1_seq4:142-3693(+)
MFRRSSRDKSIKRKAQRAAAAAGFAAPAEGSASGAQGSPSTVAEDVEAHPASSAADVQTFKALYCGMLDVPAATGAEWISKARVQTKAEHPDPLKVWLMVRPQDVLVVERKNGNVVLQTALAYIRFTAVDPEDKKHCGFIESKVGGMFVVHCIQVKEKAQAIPDAILAAQGLSIPVTEGSAASMRRSSNPRSLPGRQPSVRPLGRQMSMDLRGRGNSPSSSPPSRGSGAVLRSLSSPNSATNSPLHSTPPRTQSDGPRRPSNPLPQRPSINIANSASAGGSSPNSNRSSQRSAPDRSMSARPSPSAVAQLQRGIVNSGLYLGHETVNAISGKHICQEAFVQNQMRWRMAVSKNPHVVPAQVTLTLNQSSLKTDDRSGSQMMNTYLKDVAFSCVVQSDANGDVFTFISNDEKIGRTACHIFRFGVRVGDKLCNAITEAFKYMASQDQARRGVDPFKATDPKREAVHGELFRRQIHRSDLKAIKQIGAGQFGDVWLAEQKVPPGRGDLGGSTIKRAVKLLRNAATKADKDEFLREAEVMLELGHEHLVTIIGVALQQKPWLCVLEFMNYGDLRSVLLACSEKDILLQPYEMLVWCNQLAKGMTFLASKRLVHMDLAARNCMLGAKNVVKVGDFGLTHPFDAGQDYYLLKTRLKLALKWISPEGLDEKLFSEASDVWAFGVLMWEILMHGEIPYPDIEVKDVQQAVRDGVRLEKPPACSDKLYAIMNKCWNTDRRTRWSFAALQRMLEGELRFQRPPAPRDIGQTLHGTTTLQRGAKLAMDDSRVPSSLRTTSGSNERKAPDMADRRRSRTFSGLEDATKVIADSKARAGPPGRHASLQAASGAALLLRNAAPSVSSTDERSVAGVSTQATSTDHARRGSGQSDHGYDDETIGEYDPTKPEPTPGFEALAAALADSEDEAEDDSSGFGDPPTEAPPLPPKEPRPPTTGSPRVARKLPTPGHTSPRSQRRLPAPPQAPSRPVSQSNGSAPPVPSKPVSSEDLHSNYRERAGTLKRQKQLEKSLAAKAQQLETTAAVEAKVSTLKKSSGAMLREQMVAQDPLLKRSKIYEALNPKPLWRQTVAEKRAEDEEKCELGRIVGTGFSIPSSAAEGDRLLNDPLDAWSDEEPEEEEEDDDDGEEIEEVPLPEPAEEVNVDAVTEDDDVDVLVPAQQAQVDEVEDGPKIEVLD